ncbi:hypothetical protein MY04_0966 [Flammeovirga sp. MY04]|uniref:hypothetical protein n=1 Tax=Flammeovirga sp. MY04 TaxID=1191459 RepID=UPI0008062186|nr:hypothetical protein [Flammeovirga sp. MY04]ANQ48348.1 hypothetical protein MY04_0966 [Flammeovirga sp. MY04]
MRLQELYDLEKNDRLDLVAHNITPVADDFIFSINEYEFLKSIYDVFDQADTSKFPSFSDEQSSVIKKQLDTIDLSEKNRSSLITLFDNLSLNNDQKDFLKPILEKLNEVETDWEFKDDNRWELIDSLKNISVLFMMNEIEREFGDNDLSSSTTLTDDEFKLLSIIHEDETKNKKQVTIGNLTFDLAQLDYIREIITTLEYPEHTPLTLDQENFILNILEKCSHLNEEEPSEFHTFTIKELYEIENSSSVNHNDSSIFADSNFSQAEIKLLNAVFSEKDFVKVGDSKYNKKQLQSLKQAFEEEINWEDVKRYFSESQQELVSHIFMVYENQFLTEEDHSSETKLDVEVFFLMDQIERNEVETMGHGIGELIFSDEQFDLLTAVFRNKKSFESKRYKFKLDRQELDKIEKLFDQLPAYQSGKLVLSLPKNAKKFVDDLIQTAITNDPKI